MKGSFLSIIFLFCLLQLSFGQGNVEGRWDGSASIEMGTNFDNELTQRNFSNSSGDISAWGRYRTDKFSAANYGRTMDGHST